MKRVLKKFSNKNCLVLIDGSHKPTIKELCCKTIIKGDQKSLSIAAASIIAKITRDGIMKNLSNNYPLYKWNQNMGYGTLDHINAIKKHGITNHHRKTFKPIKRFIHNN